MSTPANKTLTPNDLILQMIKVKPKEKKTIEQIDSESLNTMDYYKEDSSTKNSLIEESKINNNLLLNAKKAEKVKKIKKEQKDISLALGGTYKGIHKSSNVIRTLATLNTPKAKKQVKRSIIASKICCKHFSNKDLTNKICIKCKKRFCKLCFNGNINPDNDNSNNEKNFKNSNICYICRAKKINDKNKNFYLNKKYDDNMDTNNKSFQLGMIPMDTNLDSDVKIDMEKSKSKVDINEGNQEKMKNLQGQYKEYDIFLKQISRRKKELEIKKDISLNLLQMIKKAIEFEYEKNINKLNEFIIRLNKIKNSINEKMNQNFNNEIELKINIDTNKNILNGFFKNYEIFSNQIITKPIFHGYKLYESNDIIINYSDTYYMKNREVFPEFPFGKVFIKVSRFTNNYINYLNFASIIKSNDKALKEEIISNGFQSFINKSRFIINMVVNNKVVRLNKTNKDTNDMSFIYEISEEEDKILFSKNKMSINIENQKKDNINIKLFISEIIL